MKLLRYLLFSFLVITLLFAVLLFGLKNTASAKHKHPERWYQERWAAKHGGITEYRLADGKRVDILTDKYAIEVDFARKFYEAVGQSLLYAARTNKIPGIILIVEKKSDKKYIKNLQEVISFWNLPIQFWVIT